MKNAIDDFLGLLQIPRRKIIRANARKNRRHYGVSRPRGQNEKRLFRRLFQDFQKRVPRAFGHPLGAFDDDDFFSFSRAYVRPFGKISDLQNRNRIIQKVAFKFLANIGNFLGEFINFFRFWKFVLNVEFFHQFIDFACERGDFRKLVASCKKYRAESRLEFSNRAQKKKARRVDVAVAERA